MRLIKLADIDRFVLRIMTLQIQRKLLGYLRGINRDLYSGNTLGEKCQHGVIYVIIDQDKRRCSRTDQVGYELVSIEQLTIVENTFYRRQRGFDEKVDFFVVLGKHLALFNQGMFHAVHTLVDRIAFQ